MNDARSALIVDDNALNSRLAVAFLKKLGWDSEVCDNGTLAFSMLKTRYFDLVLLDLRMPELPGEQVCRLIREDLGLRELPIVAYTAHSMPEERDRMLAAGFSALLIKPISFQDVRQLCESFDHV